MHANKVFIAYWIIDVQIRSAYNGQFLSVQYKLDAFILRACNYSKYQKVILLHCHVIVSSIVFLTTT